MLLRHARPFFFFCASVLTMWAARNRFVSGVSRLLLSSCMAVAVCSAVRLWLLFYSTNYPCSEYIWTLALFLDVVVLCWYHLPLLLWPFFFLHIYYTRKLQRVMFFFSPWRYCLFFFFSCSFWWKTKKKTRTAFIWSSFGCGVCVAIAFFLVCLKIASEMGFSLVALLYSCT